MADSNNLLYSPFRRIFNFFRIRPDLHEGSWQNRRTETSLWTSDGPPFSVTDSLKLSVHNTSQNNLINVDFIVTNHDKYPRFDIIWTKTITLDVDHKPISFQNFQIQSLILDSFFESILKHGMLDYHPSTLSDLLKQLTQFKENNMESIFNYSFLLLSMIACTSKGMEIVRENNRTSIRKALFLEFVKMHKENHSLHTRLSKAMMSHFDMSINLLMTNFLRGDYDGINLPSQLLSHSESVDQKWVVRVHCPVLGAVKQKQFSSTSTAASHWGNLHNNFSRLMYSIEHHNIEGYMLFNPRVVSLEDTNRIEVTLTIENIMFCIRPFFSDQHLNKYGAGSSEKHFPSRIFLKITPGSQSKVIIICDNKPEDNPPREIIYTNGAEASIDLHNTGFKGSSSSTKSTKYKAWRFEHSMDGFKTAIFNWYLHDLDNGKEVYNSWPTSHSRISGMFHKQPWNMQRYSQPDRPFMKDGRVKFGKLDIYEDIITWRFNKNDLGEHMEWQIQGEIWITYWYNLCRTNYYDTRKLEIRETLSLKTRK